MKAGDVYRIFVVHSNGLVRLRGLHLEGSFVPTRFEAVGAEHEMPRRHIGTLDDEYGPVLPAPPAPPAPPHPVFAAIGKTFPRHPGDIVRTLVEE